MCCLRSWKCCTRARWTLSLWWCSLLNEYFQTDNMFYPHSEKNNLVNETIHASILMDRNDKTSYHSRVNALVSCLDMRNRIHKVLPNEIKRYSNEMRNKFNNLFSIQCLTSMKTTGKTEIYHKIKKKYQFELKSSARAKKEFNSN